jgi:hypothetical protein
MYRKPLALLPILLGASVASAGTYTFQLPQLTPLPPAHMLHASCHDSDAASDPSCDAIRKQETEAGKTYAKTNPTTFIDRNGLPRTGRRDVYDQTKVKGTTSESSFLAASALKRFVPPVVRGASSRPDLDATDKPLIDSCDEYVYKRYYTVNRYLDTIGGYVTARKYDDAVYAILFGIPGPLQATNVQPKACLPLRNLQFTDFDNTVSAPFTLGPAHAPFEVFKPRHTGMQVRNEFMALADLVAPPPAGYIDPDPAHAGTYWSHFTAAYNASQVNAFVDDGPDGEFKRAATGRIVQLFNPLPAAEVEDIAARRIAMRKATALVGWKYSVCLLKRMRDLTATANYGPGTWQNVEQYVADPQQGWTDPVDLDEVALQLQLFNSSYANTALFTVLGADTKNLLQSGAWARSKTGSLLRALAKIDQNALATAVGATAYTIKSLTVPNGCDIHDELDAVRDLVVAEWRLPGHGCYGSTKCDYNSVLFAGDITSRLQGYTYGEDDAKRLCTGTTSDDWKYGAAPVNEIYRGTLSTLETYLRDQHTKLITILLNTPTESDLPQSIGDVRSGGSDWGNGTFGAGYSYRGEWAVNVSETGETLNQDKQKVSCSVLGGRVDGQLNAYATGFGYRKNLIDAGLTAKTKQGTAPATLSAHANILGIDLFTPIVDQALKPDFSPEDREETKSFTLATAYVTVGPFPVKVSVEVGFDWGYHMKFGYSQSACAQKPTLGVFGELAPFAGTNASVSAGIDLFVVGAGVRFTLTLVSAKLPFDASVTVGTDPQNNWAVTAKSNLSLDLTELAGKVSLYITSFGITLMEFELFSWPGLHQHIDLWHDSAVFPLIGFQSLPD